MVYHYDAECSYLPRCTYSNYGGMALYLLKQPSLNDRAQGHVPQRKKGDTHIPLGNTLLLTITTDSC